jgi:NDP-sugar pyrophosphorylase family protein
LPRLLGKMRAYPITDYLLDIGTIPNYQKAQISWPGNESKSSDQDGSVPSFENRPADSGNFQPISGAEIS